MRTIEEFVKEQGIDIVALPGVLTDTEQKDEWKRTATKWLVTLTRGGARLHVPFFMGSALTETPTAEEVLDSLASDASSYENASGFEDWASDFGYDTDSIRALRTYRQVGSQTRLLKDFMGEAYDDLLWNTERQ